MMARVKLCLCWYLTRNVNRREPWCSLDANRKRKINFRRFIFLSLVFFISCALFTHFGESSIQSRSSGECSHGERQLNDIIFLENQSKSIDQLLTQRGALNCIEKLLSARASPMPTHATENVCSYVKRAVKREILFIGDSRIRQQFYSFLEVLPEYDRIWDGEPDKTVGFQDDMSVRFPVLELDITFWWRNIISKDLIRDLRELIKNDMNCYKKLPNLIFIGINVHHMFPENGADFRIYHDELKNLKNTITNLANLTKVLWVINQPTFDFGYVYGGAKKTFVNNEKVHGYNKLAIEALRYSGTNLVQINFLEANDYIRSCLLQARQERMSFFECYHWIHLGNVVIRQNTALLLDLMCSSYAASALE